MKQILIPVCGLLFLTGCDALHNRALVQVGSDPAAVELAETAVTLNESFKDLANKTQLQNQVILKENSISPKNYGMGQVATVDWVGPAEPLVSRLAALTQYRVKVFGKEPSIPVLVSVTDKNALVGDILKDVSLQAKDRVKLLVFPSSQIIEFHYLSNS